MAKHRRIAAVLSAAIILLSMLYSCDGVCDAQYCSKCDARSATCETMKSTEVIPQDIPQELLNTMTKLKIDYQGKARAWITKSDMVIYKHLKDLRIKGNIGRIEERAFEDLEHLENLTITETQISVLPDNLLPLNSMLHTLNLQMNKLLNIPLKIFNQTRNLVRLDISANCMNISNCTLGKEFELLSSLEELKIAGMTLHMCNQTFSNINTGLKSLNMANTSASFSDPAIFSRFQKLEHLDISHIEKYAKCPHNATALFQYLPLSLKSITMRKWAYITDKPSCFLTANDMKPLHQFPYLHKLDFFSSDLIFGSNISRGFFEGLENLTELNLAYCRISRIEPHSFERNRKLKTLILDGNLIGSRYIKLQYQNYSSTIQHLSLHRTGLASDDSQVFHPVSKLINFNVTKIDLSSNFLRQCPLFDVREDGNVKFYEPWCVQKPPWERLHNVSSDYRPNLQTVILNNNKIKRFIPLKDQRLNLSHCENTPNFTHLEMEDNNLKELEGLCPSLKVIRLRNNDLSLAWNDTTNDTSNIRVLRGSPGLPNAVELDLSDNDLSYIPWDLFENMPNLKILKLSHNDISELPSNLSFKNNKKLEILDLSWNTLSYFNHRWIEDLPNLRELLLNDNLITEFEEEFFETIEDQPNTSFVRKVNILRNPILCDCDHLYLKDWLNKKTPQVQLVGAKELRCSTAGEGERIVHNYDYDINKCRGFIALYTILGIVGVACLTALIAWPCHKYKWYVQNPKIVFQAFRNAARSAKFEHDVEYDAFLSYDHSSDGDIEYVIETLLPAVETSDGEVGTFVLSFIPGILSI